MVLRVRPATAPVAINARAAVRAEIGGVERLTRELALRLPALRPDRYSVVRPPRALAHRAGHLWEQAVLPAQTAGAELILSPANLAPAASRRNVVVIHDAAALRDPTAYSRAYVAYQQRMMPLIAARAPARAHRVRFLSRRAHRRARHLTRADPCGLGGS